MIIYYLTPLVYPSNYANRLQVQKMSESFGNAGVDLTLFIRKGEVGGNFKTVVVGASKRWPRGLWYALRVARAIKGAPAETIFYSRDPLLALGLILFSAKFRKGFFFELHSLHRFPRAFYKIIFKYTLGIISTTGMKTEKIRGKKVIVAPNAAELPSITFSREEARDRLSLPKDKKIALYVGSFGTEKGADLVLEAYKLNQNKDILFLLVGSDAEKSEDGLIIKGRVPHSEVPVYLSASDVILIPPLPEYTGSPIKITESMMSNRPIVASNNREIQERLNDGDSFLFQSGSARGLLEAISQAVAHPEEASRRARVAYEEARANTWDTRARKIVDFIKGQNKV